MTIPGGRAAIEAAVARLPRWILPMLIVDQPGDAREEDLANQVRDVFFAPAPCAPDRLAVMLAGSVRSGPFRSSYATWSSKPKGNT